MNKTVINDVQENLLRIRNQHKFLSFAASLAMQGENTPAEDEREGFLDLSGSISDALEAAVDALDAVNGGGNEQN